MPIPTRNLIVGITLSVLGFHHARAEEPRQMIHASLYIGTYTHGDSDGIYRCAFNPDTGELSPPHLVAKMENPSFLAHHADEPYLYAVGETGGTADRVGGTLRAFVIAASGDLTVLGDAATRGDAPCHVAVAPSGKHVAVANYTGGNVALFPMNDKGSVGEACAVVQHEGSGPNQGRQKSPHAHAVNFDPTGELLLVADLGTDKVMIYQYAVANGTLTPAAQPSISLAPGAGPRHVAFHPTGDHLYVVNELDSTVSVFQRSSNEGRLTRIQTVSTLPEDFEGESTTAEIVVHPTGDTVYVSNRGHDSIAAFVIDRATGKLSPTGHTPTGGKTPRNFTFDLTGNWLLAANQNSDNVTVFKVQPQSGKLTATPHEAKVGAPVCLLFTPKGLLQANDQQE